MHVRSLRVMVLGGLLAGCGTVTADLRAAVRRGDVVGALRLYRAYAEDRGAGDADVLAEVAARVLRNAAESSDASERSAGFGAIAALGTRGRDLLEALARRDGLTGDRATAALYDLDGRRATPPTRLVAALRSGERERRIAGMVTLRGGRGARRLVAWLGDDDAQLRVAAARALARWRTETEVTEALAAALRTDADPMVRAAAVMALGGRNDDGVAAALAAALADRDPLVRMAAPSALVASSPTDGREAVAALLVDPPTTLAVEAARVLSARGDERGDAYLLAVLDGHTRRELRAQAAVAAPALVPRHRSALQPMLRDDDPEVVLRIASALLRDDVARPAAIAALAPLARLPDGFVAVRALAMLAQAGEGWTAEPLRQALAAPDATVRRLAVLAWGDVTGPSQDCDPLVPRLRDSDRSVALLAAVEVILVATR